MAVNEDGKFTKKDEKSVKALEEAASMDCTVDESCLLANISKQTFYNWVNEDKKLKERLDELKATPVLKARTAVIKGLDNYQNSMDYLKRKKRLEFGDNINVDGELSLKVTIQETLSNKYGKPITDSTTGGDSKGHA